MAILGCSETIWSGGRFSGCFRHAYLGIAFPASACLISLALVLFSQVSRRLGGDPKPAGFEAIATADDATDLAGSSSVEPLPRYITIPGSVLSLLEGVAIIGNFAFECFVLLHGSHDRPTPLLNWISVATLGYLLFLFATRLWISISDDYMFAQLWRHSALLYLLQWVCAVLVLHSAAVENFTHTSPLEAILPCVMFTVLILLIATAPRAPIDPVIEEEMHDSLQPSKEQTASILSRLTFFWVGGIVWRAFLHPLEASDLCDLNQEEKSARVNPSFQAAVATTLSLLSRFYRFFRRDLLAQGAWAASMSMTIYIPAMLLRLIIQYLKSPDSMAPSTAWLCVVGLLLSGVMTGVAECQCEWIGRKVGIKLRAILISEVYAKVLKRRLAVAPSMEGADDADDATGELIYTTDGNILNLMAVDAEKISEVAAYMHLLWISVPLQLIIATCMLYNILGLSGIVGLVLMTAMLPLNVWIAQRQGDAQGRVLAAMDARIQSTSEAMANIRTIKYCTWESDFNYRISQLRQIELRKLGYRFIWWSLGMTVWYSIPLIITTITLLFYTVVGKGTLESSLAFPALAVFQALRLPLDRVSDMISFVLQAFISLRRMEKFLAEAETGKYTQLLSEEESRIGFEEATFNWFVGRSVPTNYPNDLPLAIAPSFRLENLQINFKRDALNVICGPSGSGKSSLLLALLGEMHLLHGRVFFPHDGNVAYCSQEPWILNESIRTNITFGLPFDSHRYGTVIQAAALAHDFDTLDHGDQTLAGESGGRLSGGQKQRVALARALYSRAHCVLLDDCLSAVDAATARHIFFQAIKGPLMHDRTCIFATHHTHLALSHSEFAVFLENGQVRCQGTPRELASSGLVDIDLIGGELKPEDGTDLQKSNILLSLSTPSGGVHPDIALESRTFSDKSGQGDSPGYEEEKLTGSVPWRVIKAYLVSMGAGLFWTLILVAFSAQQMASLGTNLWIKKWAEEYDQLAEKSATPSGDTEITSPELKQVNAGYYLAVYGAICAVFVTVTFFRDIVIFYGALKASSKLHQCLLENVVHAKLVFFDRTPLGQISNRFSKDIEAVDQELAPYSISTIYMLSTLTMIVVFISTVLPAFLLLAVIICLVYYCIGAVYINSSRDIKRIESVQRSPLYQHFGETLRGYISIRAYGCTASFAAKTHNLIDGYNRPSLLLWAGKEWLTLRISSASAIISALTGVFVLWKLGSINPGSAGLVLTYAATFSDNILWFVQLYAIIQQNLNSVERILEYTDVDQEPSGPLRPPVVLPPHWPSKGAIRFEGYTARYAPELDPALNSITFDAPAGSRTAVVGRTGAGKSTLALALIRAIDTSEGRILLDGIDIAAVSLGPLREAISVVSQDPAIFAGSWRQNLDPGSHFADAELHAALGAVRLPLPDTAKGLDSHIEGLSRGQRQLLCIARALIRRARVLVLDEATASVDHDTDALVQPALREDGVLAAGTTVITIAHRLRTVADYDKVVVLDSGRVIEEGSVRELLGRRGPGAVFQRLCEESGDLEIIERIARAKAEP